MRKEYCDCGSDRTVHKDSIYEEIDGKLYEVEYSLYCEQCREYLGHFCYGAWEY